MSCQPVVVSKQIVLVRDREIEVEENVPTPSKKEVVEEVENEIPYVAPPPYKYIVPFPQRPVKANLEAQLKKFVELLKSLHLNVPFTEALTQMMSYVKFLKGILSHKRRLKDHETYQCVFVAFQ